MLEIFKKSSPNMEEGRRGKKPEGFVIHVSEGTFNSTLDWCTRLESQVSYHYLIREDGQIWELVAPENMAWHAGKMINPSPFGQTFSPNPNETTIGIAYSGRAEEGPTANQILSIALLVQRYSKLYTIPIDKEHVIRHHDIRTDKVCPGAKVDLDAIIYLAQLHRAPSLT